MFLAPAAMFAMFYFLSQYIQNVMGYSPLEAGFAFLPFSRGHRGRGRPGVQPGQPDRPALPRRGRHPAGGRSRCSASPRLPYDTGRSRLTDVHRAPTSPTSCPLILMMSVGMGLTFVPLTLTAVHHLRNEDSGIGSGVLNTMQQVGGALGLADPGHGRDPDLRPTAARRSRRGRRRRPPRPVARRPPPAQLRRSQAIAQQQVFTEGATQAFLVGAVLMLARLARGVDLPQRQARGAGHRRPRGRARGLTPRRTGSGELRPGRLPSAVWGTRLSGAASSVSAPRRAPRPGRSRAPGAPRPARRRPARTPG